MERYGSFHIKLLTWRVGLRAEGGRGVLLAFSVYPYGSVDLIQRVCVTFVTTKVKLGKYIYPATG